MVDHYIALDLEMTGLKVKQDKILEIGAIKVMENKVVAEMQCIINPHTKLSQTVRELTGIDESMAEQGSEEKEAIEKIIEFCNGLPLIGHNILLDFGFLKQSAVNNQIEFCADGVDTLKIARKVVPNLPSKSLINLCRYFGIRQRRCHRALEDAKAAHKLFQILKDNYSEGHEELFLPEPLNFKIKKQMPITEKQKKYLNELINYHKINFNSEMEYLTRSEASRLTDKILLQCGRMTAPVKGSQPKL